MSDPVTQTQNANLHESAFGRPASWWAAWPAMAVGLTAFLLAVYGTFWLPRRLPTQYTRALEQTQQRYQQLAEKSSSRGSERLIDAAGDMDVIYSRLVGLEGNNPERYWQWAEFQQAHADRASRILQDPALSLNSAVRQRWSEQAEHFRTKSHEILDQLALRPSELQAKSVLHVAERKYRTGLGEFGVREASGLADSLFLVLAEAESSVSGEADLTAQEIQAARLLLVQLQIESAWQIQAGSSLTCTPERLEIAWELLQDYYPQRDGVQGELAGGGENDGGASSHIGVQWRAARGLLAAMTGRKLDEAGTQEESQAAKTAEAKSLIDSGRSWSEELAQCQLAALDGDWSDVTSQLSLRAGHLDAAVTSGLARTICRLMVSPLGGGVEHADVGVLLVAQLAPHLPETSELLWECARLQAGEGSERVPVPDNVTQAIMAGQSGWLKHSLAALSATLENKPNVARTHLQLLGRAQSNASLVARVALWRSQILTIPEASGESAEVPAADLKATGESEGRELEGSESAREASMQRELRPLIELLIAAVGVEPKSGLNWFVLGTLQFRAGEFDAMNSSLAKAQELLGKLPAIEQMLDAAGK